VKWPLLALVVVGSATGDLLMTHGMKRGGEIDDFRPRAWLRSLGRAFRSGWVLLAIAAQAVSFFSFLTLLSTAELSFAVPAASAGYVVETLGARFFLAERVNRVRWAGAVLVTAGVALISL